MQHTNWKYSKNFWQTYTFLPLNSLNGEIQHFRLSGWQIWTAGFLTGPHYLLNDMDTVLSLSSVLHGQGDLHWSHWPVEPQNSFLMQMCLGKIRSVLYWDSHLRAEELCLSLCASSCLSQCEASDPAGLPDISILHVPLLSTFPGYVQSVCKNSCLLPLSHRLV